LYHQDPVYGLNRTSDLSGRYRIFLFKNFPGTFHYLKILKKKKEIEFLLKHSDKLVFLSDESKRQITNELKISTLKLEAINNPCVSHNIQGTNLKKKQILFVGEIVLAPKRPDKMLQIWSNLQGKFSDWELIFLGDGPDRTKVEEMAKSTKLKNVRFEGFVNPVPYYKEASVLCMTSDCEGFGLVLTEAMQFGMAPITFNNWSAIKDIIINDETGILVETDNINEYCEKLSHLLSNEEYRNRISENAREHIKKFDIEVVGLHWLKLFQSLLISGN
jgi:glycosyltransferase involved in cell wall biosynthesis